uniref:Uncharacterized protein n=1 Tax=viral metagenome TaxID=1070528 RepID=A0A6M3J1L2_9ZZZZ
MVRQPKQPVKRPEKVVKPPSGRDPLIDRAVAADPKIAAADARMDRLLNAMHRCQQFTPEAEDRLRALAFAHKAALLHRNRLIAEWQSWDEVGR